MKCAACNGDLTALEEQINEWGVLETLCDRCIVLSRPSIDMDEFTTMLWNAIGSDTKRRLPAWISHIRRSGGALVGYENEPYWDEETEEYINDGGRFHVIREFD